ncbi:hypothetical protein BH11MYX4_BH11MYX4_24900 [soil metagenome]
MDEAERCHRLAFIFRGVLLDVGTPQEIVARRELRVVEVEVDRPHDAAAILRARADVEEVAHLGPRLRLATRGGADPRGVLEAALGGFAIGSVHETRATVEDAFVSMVRAEATNGGPS